MIILMMMVFDPAKTTPSMKYCVSAGSLAEETLSRPRVFGIRILYGYGCTEADRPRPPALEEIQAGLRRTALPAST